MNNLPIKITTTQAIDIAKKVREHFNQTDELDNRVLPEHVPHIANREYIKNHPVHSMIRSLIEKTK